MIPSKQVITASSRSQLGKLNQSSGVSTCAFSPQLSFPWLNFLLLFPTLDTFVSWKKVTVITAGNCLPSSHTQGHTALFLDCLDIFFSPCHRIRGCSVYPDNGPWRTLWDKYAWVWRPGRGNTSFRASFFYVSANNMQQFTNKMYIADSFIY